MNSTRSTKRARAGRRSVAAARARRSRTPWIVAAGVVLAVVALFAIYRSATPHAGAPSTGGNDRYSVGSPGVGALAPDFALPNVTGAGVGAAPLVRLGDFRGKTVLLYLHEGLGCQPCWDQIRDLQKNPATLTSLGVDQLVTITSGPPDLVAQKMRDDGLTAAALVDTDLAVSKRYQANQYGMMGTDRDGHSFVLVGPDGRIQWRADYGGAPNYTMYVPLDQLAADLRAGRAAR
ncbi:MAG: peroxiredoxin family protein [Actinomycetota bacterium]|nr:peroxiredoxin family protein [Actinomycetota bacterium]